MKPTQDNLLVRILPEVVKEGEEKAAATDMFTAEVMKAGPTTKEVKVGETVLFSPIGVAKVVVDEEELVVVNEGLIQLHGKKA